MTVQIAFPFGEQIRNQGTKLVRHQSGFEVRSPQPLPCAPNLEIMKLAIRFPLDLGLLRVNNFRKTAFDESLGIMDAQFPGRGGLFQCLMKIGVDAKCRCRFGFGLCGTHAVLLTDVRKWPSVLSGTSR